MDKQHKCHIKPLEFNKYKSTPTLFFFDFETKTDENNLMIPFYCVVQKVCRKCEKIPFHKNFEYFLPDMDYITDLSIDPVDCCGYRQFVFDCNNDDVTSRLAQFMLEQKNSVWIAHNGGRFDTIFLLKYLLTEKNLIPETVMNGNKILSLKIKEINLQIIDSFSFLSMKLAKFPESLEIDNIVKGYHPYKFFDLMYRGNMIDKKYFDISENDKNDFNTWYDKQCEKEYVFRDAIYYYCSNDVNILRLGCIKFSNLIYNITNILPFYDTTCITIAGLTLKIFRSNYLQDDKIAQIPSFGYRGNTMQSLIALCWLSEVKSELDEMGYTLEYKLSINGERKILGRFVDGYCEENNTVYQFHGCFFHGCNKCFNNDDYNTLKKEKMYFLRMQTKQFSKQLIENNYNVVEMWECEYLKDKNISEIKSRKEEFFNVLPLHPRDALYGGRTSPSCLYYEVKENEKVKYVDFTSLYPYVQKKYEYPLNHPEIYLEEECLNIDVGSVFGLIKCCILPPTTLLFPVLPLRIDNKLIFTLCYTCAMEKNRKCNHNDEKRALRGTWTSVEINKAIECGYRIIKIYEIYHYKNRGKIFGGFVDNFMKMKQENSCIPKECYNETEDETDNEDEKTVNEEN